MLQTTSFPRLTALLCTTSLALLAACGGGGGDAGTPQPTATGATIAAASGAPRYGQPALVTINGANLDQPMSAASPGCTPMTRSTTAPNISTATTAYYTCNVVGVGPQTVTITRNSDGGTLTTAPYSIPMPQVTMTVSNGVGVNGSLVFTLAPDKAPITVDNFLAYVNSGFYIGTIFHRVISTPTPFVIQGGGFLPITTLPPAPKAGLRPAIVLEDDKDLLNTQWSVAMARTGVADSATSQFFVNLVANSFLDRTATARGYAVFGSVTTNTALATAISNAPCSAITGFSECAPSPNVVINSATQTQ